MRSYNPYSRASLTETWLSQFQVAVLELRPDLAGKIDQTAAKRLSFSGYNVAQATEIYLASLESKA
jgi:hypothetical protein